MKKYRKTVALDFDGVIHKHISKWTFAHQIHDGPVDGAFDFIEAVLSATDAEGDLLYDLTIFSARASDRGGAQAMWRWLEKEALLAGKPERFLDRVNLTHVKPHAFIYIDDRGWRFEGTFPTMEELRSFEPWMKKLEKKEGDG